MKWITRHSIVLTLALLVSAGLMGTFPESACFAREAGSGSPTVIEGIHLSEGAKPELVVKLSGPATYTSYKALSPLRLVVDLSQTTPGDVSAPLTFNRGNFKSVTARRYDTEAGIMTRLEVELAADAEAVFAAADGKGGELRISFPDVTLPETPAPAATSAPVPLPAKQTASQPVQTTAATTGVAPVLDRVLTAVTVKDDSIVMAISNGADEIKTMRLNKPERFVVDLPGVRSGMADRLIPINLAGIASARIGLYPEKLRVVFDSVNGGFPDASAVKSDEGVTVSLHVARPAVQGQARKQEVARVAADLEAEQKHSLSTPAATAPAASAPLPKDSAAPVAAPQSAAIEPPAAKLSPPVPASPKTVVKSAEVSPTVEMIDFQVLNGISRISVRVSGNVAAAQPEQTAGFVTLTLKNTSLPKQLQRSLETKGFASPVLRVTPLVVKTRKGIDTRIRVALRAPTSYEFHREGDVFHMDFVNPNGIVDKSAASPDLQELQPSVAAPGAKGSAKSDSELDRALSTTQDSARPAKKYSGRKVSLEFADAEVRKIFQLLSEVSNRNFVLGDDVTGTISIKLVNVPWDQALDIILDTKGLDKREDGNIIIIKGKGKFKSQAEEEQEIRRALTRAIELKTETFSINYADISGIAAQFASLKTDRGSIAQDPRTNKVIVKDIPQALDDMRRLLAQLDVPEKQVMIEARIVEATSTFTRNLGVNWGIHYRDGSASFMGINSLDTGFGGLTSAPPTSGTGTTAGGNMGISFGTLTSNIQLDMRLNAAASAGLIKIVSTPKVATLNNKTAKITQGQQIPYTSSTSDKVETKFIEAALSLEVTPHINANGTIGMKIDAKNDSPGAGGNPPPINKKQATTEMLLRDGETTVIGGIYVDSDTEADDGVPFLMDIPLLGKMFKTNNKSKTKTELLIFITPRILGTI